MQRATIALLGVLAAGCYTHKPVTAADSEAETVRIHFAPAANVRLTGTGDSSRVVSVRELRGLVLSVQEDSIRLIVSKGETATGAAVVPGEIAMIPRSPEPQLERRRMSISRSFGAVGAIATGIAAVFIFFYQLDK